MTDTEVIDRVATEAKLKPEAVERVLELAGESVREAAEEHGVVLGSCSRSCSRQRPAPGRRRRTTFAT
jgi:hypothetical protein